MLTKLTNKGLQFNQPIFLTKNWIPLRKILVSHDYAPDDIDEEMRTEIRFCITRAFVHSTLNKMTTEASFRKEFLFRNESPPDNSDSLH
jgi:hypothetical protein